MNALAAALWGAFAASSLVLGAWLAVHFRPSSAVTGHIMGFGSGALLSAVAYELVPVTHLERPNDFVGVGVGAVVFFLADRAVARRAPAQGSGGAERSIVLGALLDGIPESVVLGMGLAAGGSISVAFVAAVFLSNLPESLGATAAMGAEGRKRGEAYRVWWGITAISAVCAAVGYVVVSLLPGATGKYAEAFAAGAVLTMLADSMMPEAAKLGGRLTGLFTVLGFAAAGSLSILG